MSYGKYKSLLKALKSLKVFKGFNSLKISLKTVLKKFKDIVFKERRFYQILLLKNKNLLISYASH